MHANEPLVISWDAAGLAAAAATLLGLGLATAFAARRWGLSRPLLLLLALDAFVLGWELPSRALEQVRVDDERFLLVGGPWFAPIEVAIELASVEAVYEIRRSRHWLERDTYWVFQDQRFRRRRLHLSPLLYRQRKRVAAHLALRGVPVIVHVNLTPHG